MCNFLQNSFSAHIFQSTRIFLLENALVFAPSRSKGSSKHACSTSFANHGFTLLEVMVSVAILALVASVGWFSFASYAARRELDSSAARVAALITEAQRKTLAGEDSSAYGVHFESDRAVLFRAPSYVSGSADNKTEMLTRRITIPTISFSGNEVIFKRLTGAAVSAGSVTLSVRGNSSVSKTVSVNALGVVEGE